MVSAYRLIVVKRLVEHRAAEIRKPDGKVPGIAAVSGKLSQFLVDPVAQAVDLRHGDAVAGDVAAVQTGKSGNNGLGPLNKLGPYPLKLRICLIAKGIQ